MSDRQLVYLKSVFQQKAIDLVREFHLEEGAFGNRIDLPEDIRLALDSAIKSMNELLNYREAP